MGQNTDPVRKLLLTWDRRAAGAHPSDAMLMNKHTRELREALASAPPSAPDRMAIQMLVAAGFVTDAKANEALQIAHGFISGPLEPPSAPVGVEAVLGFLPAPLTHSQAWPQEYVDGFNACAKLAEEQVRIALSQQPAAPSGEAVAEVVHADGAPGGVLIKRMSGVGRNIPHGTKLYAAPQQPAAVDEAAALDDFTAYFVKNYPGPNTIIGDPKWHAPRIFRAAQRALAAQRQGGTP